MRLIGLLLTLDSNQPVATLINKLDEAAIEARPLWKPLHLQPVFEGNRYFGNRVEEKLFLEGICLPSGSSLTDEERAHIINQVRSCF